MADFANASLRKLKAIWPRRKRRSAGISVSQATYDLIRQGNTLRSHDDWEAAAEAYELALAAEPHLSHIRIQLGHARSETGDCAAAITAYQSAIAAGSDAGAAWLYIGHALKRAGQPSYRIVRSYLQAARNGNADGLDELTRAVADMVDLDPSLLGSVISDSAFDPVSAQSGETALFVSGRAASNTTYDLSDLVSHFRHHRLPTGIQRLQMEIIQQAMTRDDGCRICCFIESRETLIQVPPAVMRRVLALARRGAGTADPAWRHARALLFLSLAAAAPFEFYEDECLVNLGTSWWIYNYHLLIRNAKLAKNIRFAVVVFDLIPVLASDLCVRGIAEDYVNWLIGAFDHTDLFIAISESTANDLISVARQLGVSLSRERVEVVPLDADFRMHVAEVGSEGELTRFGLTDTDYVLCVSTIEARKNHILALRAWAALLERDDASAVPRLVFAGRDGWLNAEVYQMLANNPDLRARVTLIHSGSDADLSLLYRHCLFTVYPSLYEGWGLPVTESLCYGKLPVVAANSSLLEAGGSFALYFESNSVTSLIEAVVRPINDRAWLREQEDRIVQSYQPRSWLALADQIAAAVSRISPADADVTWAEVQLGLFYPIGRHAATRIWAGLRAGEKFRIGDGWHWPDKGGCDTRPGGAALAIDLPTVAGGRARIALLLRGLTDEDCPYALTSGSQLTDGTLEPGTVRWSRFLDIDVVADGRIVVKIEGAILEWRDRAHGGRSRRFATSIGVVGFVVLPEGEDAVANMFYEAVVLEDLGKVTAYAEPLKSTLPAARAWSVPPMTVNAR